MNDFVNKVIQLSKKQELIDLELKIKKEELKKLELWNKKIETEIKHDNIKKILEHLQTLVMLPFLSPFILCLIFIIGYFMIIIPLNLNTESDKFFKVIIHFNNTLYYELIEFIDGHTILTLFRYPIYLLKYLINLTI